jgi:hypothetical protein
MAKALKTAAHVTLFSLTIHVWHLATSDRMLDAAADVGLDKVATLALRAARFEEAR